MKEDHDDKAEDENGEEGVEIINEGDWGRAHLVSRVGFTSAMRTSQLAEPFLFFVQKIKSVLIGCLEIAKRFDVPNKKLTQINCQILGKGNGSQQFFRDLPFEYEILNT